MKLILALILGSLVMAAQENTIAGKATYRERMAMPAGAKLVVELLDVSKADAKAVLIAKTEMEGLGQVPVPFVISFDAGKIDSRMSYHLAARIDVAGRMMFRTTQAYPVLNGNPVKDLMLLLQRVGGRGPLEGSDWVLESMGGKPSAADVTTTLAFAGGGKVNGKGGCNNYFAQAEFDGQKLSLSKAGSTMMACPGAKMEQESAYLKALAKVKAWKREGAKLVLETDGAGDLVFGPLKK
jgi:putative lipoprotein